MLKSLRAFKNFIKRPPFEIFLVFESLFHLLRIKFLIKKYSFNKLSKSYNLKLTKDENFKNKDIKKLKQITWAIERSSQLLPWDGLCLVKALTAHIMLKKRKLSAIIYMGVKKDSQTNELEAHAWVKANNQILTGKQGHKNFTVVSMFTWDI